MKKWIVAAVMLVALGLAVFVVKNHQSRRAAPWVKLPDGSSVRILAVTYGTNHLVGSEFAKATARLPAFWQNIVKSLFGTRATQIQATHTLAPELLVWLEQQTNVPPAAVLPNNPYIEAVLGDGSNFISGEQTYVPDFRYRSPVEQLHFPFFPRRDREITLNFFYHDAGKVSHCGQASFENPQFRTYPNWQAEPLPATKHVGDLEVTLEALETGHDNSIVANARADGSTEYSYGTNRLDGKNYTLVVMKIKPLTNTNEAWQVASVAMEDATGNHAPSRSMGWSGGMVDFVFEPGLWPGETAWKLRLAIKRVKGFRPDELLEFKNVPLGEMDHTNTIAWTTNCPGLTLTLQSIHRCPPLPKNSWDSSHSSEINFTHSALPADSQLDLLDVVYDSGTTNHSENWSYSNNTRAYRFRAVPAEAKTADFVFALHRTQTVEFTVKPELPKANLEQKKQSGIK